MSFHPELLFHASFQRSSPLPNCDDKQAAPYMAAYPSLLRTHSEYVFPEPTPTRNFVQGINRKYTQGFSRTAEGMPWHFEQGNQNVYSPTGPLPITPAVDSSKFPFERLPPEIFQRILSCLYYKSLIAFSCTNRYLHNAVNPQTASQEDKVAFVRHAEMYFPQHFSMQDEDWPGQNLENSTGRTGNFACYSCFRVRGSEHFLWDSDDFPHGQGYAPRRVCTDCIPCAPIDIFFGR